MTTTVVHRYAPRGMAREVFTSRDSEILLGGPAGTGKSRACLEKLHAVAQKYPGMRGLIMRKTAASLGNTALITWEAHVAKESLQYGVCHWYGGSSKESAGYRFTNGSKIDIGGIDKPEKIMSSEYDIVYAQEATELFERDWDAVTTRLRNGKMPYQQLMADCNPQHNKHWLKVRCDSGRTRMINTRHTDNPVYFNEDGTKTELGESYMSKLEALTGVTRLRLLDGIWASAEGVIYEDWRDDIHVIDQMPRGWETWPRYWSVDFGFKNPFVCQFWAEDPDGRVYLYREIYYTGRLVEDHARQIAHLVMKDPMQMRGSDKSMEPWTGKWLEPRPVAILADHDAEDRVTLERHLDISTTAADKTVSVGIESVQGRLRDAGDGRPRLFILRGALVERDSSLDDAKKPASTLEELPGYVWATSSPGKPEKDEPLKLNDHGCDAMRYLVMECDNGARPIIRWV